MTIQIKPVKSKKELKQFIKLPWKIYKNDSNWVPPLISQMKDKFNREKYPYYEFSEVQPFLAFKDGEPAGRIVAHINSRHNETHNENIGFFGFYECIPNQDVSTALFETACNWVRERGKDAIRGPMNFSTNEECGLLVKGFSEPPLVMMTYNPEYYQHHIENFGFTKTKDLNAFYADYNKIPDRFVRVMEKIRKRGKFVIHKINPKNFKEEVARIFDVYNKAWQHNWGYVPMTKAEFDHLAKDLKPIVDFDLIYLVVKDGKDIAFSLALPDIYQALIKIRGKLLPFGWLKLLLASKKIDQVRVITLGIIDAYKNLGIDAALYYETIKNALKKGRARGEMSWILEDNARMVNAAIKMGGKLYKNYRIYDKILD